jgi:hypothetical protein
VAYSAEPWSSAMPHGAGLFFCIAGPIGLESCRMTYDYEKIVHR